MVRIHQLRIRRGIDALALQFRGIYALALHFSPPPPSRERERERERERGSERESAREREAKTVQPERFIQIIG